MRVLILGATGSIGKAIAADLHARGHAVVGVSRRRAEAFERNPDYGWIAGDLHRDLDPATWLRRLHAFDAVLNCAVLGRENAQAHFETVHALGPVALYQACERAGVRRVVHLTPAGDPASKRSPSLATRHYAERHLQSLALDWVVVAYPRDVALPQLCAAAAEALENPEATRRRLTLESAKLKLLYDGACPICSLEMRRLQSLDSARRLECLDIAAPGFDPTRYGSTMSALMNRMHALGPDGRLLVGMDAIRAAYTAVGLGWLLAATRLPLLKNLADRAYLAFARNRYAISRRLGL
jgi:predicted DCC family thiol-disulfide oxidoreductase YuxK